MFHTIFFDLDNTLYSRKSGIWEAIGQRINLYMKDVLHIPEADIMPMRENFVKKFGTSMRGLKSIYELDDMEYLAYVHDVDLNTLLTDDGSLRNMLEIIPQRKIIFTNSDIFHTKRVLDFFKIQSMFDLIIDVIAISPHVKPQPEAYQKALDLSGLDSAEGCIFIDDMIENVNGGQEAGFTSILVGKENSDTLAIHDIFKFPSMLQMLEEKKSINEK